MKRKPSSSFLSILIVLAAAILGFDGKGRCAPQPGPLWDKDGGFSYDYSGIPRLEWMGPEEPDTYEEYLTRRERKPFKTELIYRSNHPERAVRTSKALLLVNESLYDQIDENFARYVSDLEADGYMVEAHATSGGDAPKLKDFILENADDLVGCVFVGDHSIAWFEDDYWGFESFACDLYYMDLDGEWIDNDQDGAWDEHTAGGGDQGPEIFIGHIDASMMSGMEGLNTNNYFDKNHSFRVGAFSPPPFALSYTDDDWASSTAMRTDIQYAYFNFDDIYAPATDRNDYLTNRIPNPAYEFIQVCTHSSATGHYFTRGGVAWNDDIIQAVPYAVFYNLFACSGARYTTDDFIGGSYLYNSSETSLAVIGSTKTGSMLAFLAFYQPFGLGTTFGEAFRQWFNHLAPYSDSEVAWHYGMAIAGDPFLTRPAHPIVTAIDPASGPAAGGTAVTISGSRFSSTPETQVMLGDSSALDVNVIDGNTITCTTPEAAIPGAVHVIVSDSSGSGILMHGFTYTTPPVVSAVTPDYGHVFGGDLFLGITIYGAHFTTTEDTTVTFGGVAAENVNVLGEGALTCTLPPHEEGPVAVGVANSEGYGELAMAFSYQDRPALYYLGGHPSGSPVGFEVVSPNRPGQGVMLVANNILEQTWIGPPYSFWVDISLEGYVTLYQTITNAGPKLNAQGRRDFIVRRPYLGGPVDRYQCIVGTLSPQVDLEVSNFLDFD